MPHLLLIEDEPRLARALEQGLSDDGHRVEVASDGLRGLGAAEAGQHDLIILDLLLPGLPGLEVCRRLRAQGRATPILMLTARDTTADIVAGLDAGADDYLVKPFVLAELLARCRSLLRRAVGSGTRPVSHGPLTIDVLARRVWREGQEVILTATEFRLLEALVRRPGAVLSKARLTELVWEGGAEPESNAIEVHVANLRRKIDGGRAVAVLQTIRGVGYCVRWA